MPRLRVNPAFRTAPAPAPTYSIPERDARPDTTEHILESQYNMVREPDGWQEVEPEHADRHEPANEIEELVRLQIRQEQEERERIAQSSQERDEEGEGRQARRRRDTRYLLPERLDLPKLDREWAERSYDKYEQQLQHRTRWIFRREEREGFVRRQCAPFSLADLQARLATQPNHPMNNRESRFFDWKMGGTDFIMRLEYYTKQYEQDREEFELDSDDELPERHYLRCYYVYIPKNMVICYSDRLWDGNNQFKEQHHYWVEPKSGDF